MCYYITWFISLNTPATLLGDYYDTRSAVRKIEVMHALSLPMAMYPEECDGDI